MTVTLADVLAAASSLERGNNGGGVPPAGTCAHGHSKEKYGEQQYSYRRGRRVKNGIRCLACKRIAQWTEGSPTRLLYEAVVEVLALDGLPPEAEATLAAAVEAVLDA